MLTALEIDFRDAGLGWDPRNMERILVKRQRSNGPTRGCSPAPAAQGPAGPAIIFSS
jgi:hypothetical protein